MGFRLFVARRYLAGRRQTSLINVITGLSIAGVALGVASLIVVLSVMNGFYEVVRGLLVSMDPHVRIENASGAHISQSEADALEAEALTLAHVVEASPFVEGRALMVRAGGESVNRVVIVRGVEPDESKGEVVAGRFDVASGGLVLGMNLGQRLGLLPGSDARVTLYSAQMLGRMLTGLFAPPPVRPFEVRGLFSLEETYDNTHVFIGLPDAQALFAMPDAVTGVEIRLSGLDHASAVQDSLQQSLAAQGMQVRTWYDLQRSLYDVMRLEKWGASLVLILISVVAAFNIVGSLTMIVIEKRRDVGVLQAMGASRADIRRIFVLEGVLIGALGAGTGLGVGLGLALLQQLTGIVPLASADSFVIDAYPVAIRGLDVAAVAVVSFALCVAASAYPALRAARVAPARAVQLDR